MILDDDDIFGGSPRKKYFDIMFTANRNLVEQHLLDNIDYMAALEMLLEEMLGEDKDVPTIAKNYIYAHLDEIAERSTNLLIHGMGDVVSKNE